MHFGHPFEKEPPRGKQIFFVPRDPFLETDEVGKANLDPLTFLGISQMLLH